MLIRNKGQLFIEKLSEKLIPISSKIQSITWLSAISEGIGSILAIITIGAFSTTLIYIPIDAYQTFISNTGLLAIFELVNNMTLNIFSLYVCIAIAYRYANKLGVNVLSGIIMSLTFYLELLPGEEGVAGISITYLGAQGMFVAIIAALVSVKIIAVFEKKGLTIRLAEGIPQFVIDSFKIFISGTFIVLLGSTISWLFVKTSYGSFPGFIYDIIQAPFVSVAGSLGGMILVSMVSEVFFFCGIYGTVISGLLMPIRMAATTANAEMMAAGMAPTEIFSLGSLDFVSPGGAGSTLALAFLLFFIAKSKRYKSLGKAVILPQICSINEPIIYGLPIILNPVMIIPFSMTTAVNHVIYYLVCKFGLMPVPYGMIGMGCPSIFIILMNGCGILGILWWLVILAVDACIYFPFFKVLDNQALKEEGENGLSIEDATEDQESVNGGN